LLEITEGGGGSQERERGKKNNKNLFFHQTQGEKKFSHFSQYLSIHSSDCDMIIYIFFPRKKVGRFTDLDKIQSIVNRTRDEGGKREAL
jgi:hypothetical protein